MKRYLTVTVCLFFLSAGIVTALGDCFGRDHHEPGENHHAALNIVPVNGDAHSPDETQSIHCPERSLAVPLAVSILKPSNKKLLDEKRLDSGLDLVRSRNAASCRNFRLARGDLIANFTVPSGLSPHLFLSIIRI